MLLKQRVDDPHEAVAKARPQERHEHSPRDHGAARDRRQGRRDDPEESPNVTENVA